MKSDIDRRLRPFRMLALFAYEPRALAQLCVVVRAWREDRPEKGETTRRAGLHCIATNANGFLAAGRMKGTRRRVLLVRSF